MKIQISRVCIFTFLCFLAPVTVHGGDDTVRLGSRLAAQRSAAQEMKMLRSSLQVYSGPDDERTLGDIAGFEVTVKYGTVRLKRKWWDWGVEFTTLLPNLHPGGPGNRRGIDLY
jgi:hypothetical protein